jgi:hypothetical protein
MSVIELLLAGVIILNIVLLFVLISLVRDLVAMKMMVQQVHSAFGAVMNKLGSHDILLAKIGNAFNELTSTMGNVVDKLTMLEQFPPQMGSLYRTMDGKYIGSTLEDLIKKIQASGEEQTYLSPDELDGLRKLFDDDDDDDDEETTL